MTTALPQTTDSSFETEILRSSRPAIVDFWAGWCPPCGIIAGVLEELAELHDDAVKVARINVDENPQTPSTYGIKSLPTLLVFRDGKVVEQVSGAVPRPELERLFRTAAGLDENSEEG